MFILLSVRAREVLHTKVVKNIKTHFMFDNFFFFLKKIMPFMSSWKDVEPDRSQVTVWAIVHRALND